MAGDPTVQILFTPEGRREVQQRLGAQCGLKNLIACERGFLDNEYGGVLTDAQALNILCDPQYHKNSQVDPLLEATRLNDQAELTLDKVLQRQARGMDALIYTFMIDSTWFALKNAREKAGRELPKES